MTYDLVYCCALSLIPTHYPFVQSKIKIVTEIDGNDAHNDTIIIIEASHTSTAVNRNLSKSDSNETIASSPPPPFVFSPKVQSVGKGLIELLIDGLDCSTVPAFPSTNSDLQ